MKKQNSSDNSYSKIEQDIRAYFSEVLKRPNLNFEFIRSFMDILERFQGIASGIAAEEVVSAESIMASPFAPRQRRARHGYRRSLAQMVNSGMANIGGVMGNQTGDFFQELLELAQDMNKQPPESRALDLFKNAEILEQRGDKELASRCRKLAEQFLNELTTPPNDENDDTNGDKPRPIELPTTAEYTSDKE